MITDMHCLAPYQRYTASGMNLCEVDHDWHISEELREEATVFDKLLVRYFSGVINENCKKKKGKFLRDDHTGYFQNMNHTRYRTPKPAW